MPDPITLKHWHKILIIWVGILICGFAMFVAIGNSNWQMIVLLSFSMAYCIAALIVMRLQFIALRPFRPGKGFWYYRSAYLKKINALTVIQIILFLTFVWVLIWPPDNHGSKRNSPLVTLLFLIVVIQLFVKPRGQQSQVPVDNIFLFELEDLGIIRSTDAVVYAYKGFSSWAAVNDGDKVLLLMSDRLIVVRMLNPNEGERIEILLGDIDRLGILTHGKQGLGLILSVGLSNGPILRFTLDNRNLQYSLEIFVSQLLGLLDKRGLGQADNPDSALPPRFRPEGYSRVKRDSIPVIRSIDLRMKSTASATEASHQPSFANKKVLEF
ncbi:hypothetical protein [Cohnella mopanensis]|uniref:hypothetical protein n=1 Tax=Cohnella mopanensis TaxID=2911966 RepID=UPI001EF754E5|nr:hypothetical protein [Cohnella mopanensis]